MHEFKDGDLPDVRSVVKHILAINFAACDRVRLDVKVNVNGAFRESVGNFAERGIGNRRAEFWHEIFIVSDSRVVSFFLRKRVVFNLDGDRHDGGESSENAGDARLAVLIDAPDNVTDARELNAGCVRAAYRTDNRCVGHEEIDVAGVREGVTERQNLFTFDGGDGTGCAEREISVDNRDTQSRAGLKRCVEFKPAFDCRRSRLQIFQAKRLT